MFPTRYIHLAQAKAKHGDDHVERLGQFLWEADNLADAAVDSLASLSTNEREARIDAALDGQTHGPDALMALAQSVRSLPLWWNAAAAERGARTIRRSGLAGGVTLAFKSLMTAYCSPAGNKPLMFSARLEEDVRRRLAETGRFVESIARPEGLRPHTAAFRATLRVRLVHAQVRRMLKSSKKWNAQAWGTPINQVDMAGTVLLFSYVFLQGIETLGLHLTPQDQADVLHLWRGVGTLLGVAPELLCATIEEAERLWDLISCTQGEPDEDSRRLAHALLEGARPDASTPVERAHAAVASQIQLALTWALMGPDRARSLRLPRSPLRWGLPLLRRVVRTLDRSLQATPFGAAAVLKMGEAYWRGSVEEVLQGIPATFGLPSLLPRL